MLRSLGLTAPQLPDLQLAGAHLPATAVWAYGELTPLVTPASRPGVGPLPPLSKIKTLKAPLG